MQDLNEKEVQIIMRGTSPLQSEINKQPNQPLVDQDISYIAQSIIQQTGRPPQLQALKKYVSSYYQNISNQSQVITPSKQPQKQVPLFKNFQPKSNSQNHSIDQEDPKLIPKINVEKKINKQTVSFKSKRKIKLTQNIENYEGCTIQQKLQNLQNANNDCHQSTDKKTKRNSGKDIINIHQSSNWFFNEYFYSNYDKPFFKNQQYLHILNQLGFDPKNMTYYQNRMLRRALPQPKIFTLEFINDQINSLKQNRKEIRQLARQRQSNRDDIIQLTANRSVIALHPICGHLHLGSILVTYRQNEHVVKFYKPQLGTHKILDIYISSEITNNRQLNQPNQIDKKKDNNNPNIQLIENVDYQVMGIAIKLLDYKTQLITKLKQYNDQVTLQLQRGEKISQSYLQQYGWIGTTINIVSMGLKHIIARFRLRGLLQSNQQQITTNFTSLLINPLNLMSRQMQNSSQMADLNISNKIHKMISQQKQKNTEDKLNELFNNYKNNLQIENNDKENIQQLVRNCLGILIDLKIHAKDFDINQNKYLKSLLELTNANYQEHFNQIFDKLHSIIKKIKQI